MEDLRVLLNLRLITALGGVDQDQQRHVGFQEAVAHVVHHRFAQLPAQVARLAVHLVDGSVETLGRFLLARLTKHAQKRNT